jgi:hypothetical protein
MRFLRVVGAVASGAAVVWACHSGSDVGQSCAADGDCQSLESCSYPIADGCSAKGVCEPRFIGGDCSTYALCACGGGAPLSPCGFQEGYAPGPTTGANCTPPPPSEDSGACLTLSCGMFDPDGSVEPTPCDPDASEPCDLGKDNNPCVTIICDPNQRVCVWVPVEPVPSGCVGADAASDASDAADDGNGADASNDASDAASE